MTSIGLDDIQYNCTAKDEKQNFCSIAKLFWYQNISHVLRKCIPTLDAFIHK